MADGHMTVTLTTERAGPDHIVIVADLLSRDELRRLVDVLLAQEAFLPLANPPAKPASAPEPAAAAETGPAAPSVPSGAETGSPTPDWHDDLGLSDADRIEIAAEGKRAAARMGVRS